jgi:hypothetical protein
MQVTGLTSLILLVAIVPCVIVPLLILAYLFVKERRK